MFLRKFCDVPYVVFDYNPTVISFIVLLYLRHSDQTDFHGCLHGELVRKPSDVDLFISAVKILAAFT